MDLIVDNIYLPADRQGIDNIIDWTELSFKHTINQNITHRYVKECENVRKDVRIYVRRISAELNELVRQSCQSRTNSDRG